MKIGILTFHNSRNYGAVLQAYGLQEVLKSLGHEVNILDYQNPQIAYRKSPFSIRRFFENPAKYIQRLLNIYIGYKKAIRYFGDFEKRSLNVKGDRLSAIEIRDYECDVLVVGSDQVWSTIITGGPDPVYWGMEKPKFAKLITYAASSCDTKYLETEEFKDISKWLEHFSAISVREERLKFFIERFTSNDVSVVLDPTLLAGRSIFEKITGERCIKEPYVLLYHVETSPGLLKIARSVSKKYNAKLVSISPLILSERIKNRDICYYQANVYEMLSLIKYAECVVALSFHGTALSVIYEKDFYSIAGKNMARVETLLKNIGLMDRIVNDPDDVSFDNICFDEPTKKLQLLRSESLEWLISAL